MAKNMFFRKEKLIPVFKWACYYLFLLIGYTLQTIPNLFEAFSIKAVFVLPIALCVCMFEGVMGSAVFCTVAGLLWDISSDKLFGFNAIILIVIGSLISLLCIYYLRAKLLNAVGFITVTVLVQGLLDYVFYYALWGFENPVRILVGRILPTAGYTVLISPIIFFLIKLLATRFHEAQREWE